MFEFIFKIVLLCILGILIVSGLIIIFGISLFIGWAMGTILEAFWQIPKWLGMTIITMIVAASMISSLVGRCKEKDNHNWTWILVIFWLLFREFKEKNCHDKSF